MTEYRNGHDALRAALAHAGQNPDAVDAIIDFLDDTMYAVSYDFRRAEAQRKFLYEQEQAAAKDANLAATVPYKGKIKYCQASVHYAGRMVGFHRCGNLAKRVMRLNDIERDKRNGGDGRLAVCTVHAKEGPVHVRRHTSDSKWEAPSALEPVEPEYQP